MNIINRVGSSQVVTRSINKFSSYICKKTKDIAIKFFSSKSKEREATRPKVENEVRDLANGSEIKQLMTEYEDNLSKLRELPPDQVKRAIIDLMFDDGIEPPVDFNHDELERAKNNNSIPREFVQKIHRDSMGSIYQQVFSKRYYHPKYIQQLLDKCNGLSDVSTTAASLSGRSTPESK